MKIGVVSDTHGYFEPRLREVLAGVDVILHAGDVDSQVILEELSEIAPVHAVRGNVDGTELGLPLTRTLRFDGHQILLQHILPVPQSDLEAWASADTSSKTLLRKFADLLNGFDPQTRVVIFGHSHQPCMIALSGILFFNPGSAGKRRFSLPRCCGMLEISRMEIRGTMISLENEPRPLPAEVVVVHDR